MNGSVKYIRLVTGEIIIGIIDDGSLNNPVIDDEQVDDLKFDDFCFTIHYPFKLMSKFDLDERTHEIHLEDWSPFSRDLHEPILKDKVVSIGNPSDDVFELYNTHQQKLATDLSEYEEGIEIVDKNVLERKQQKLKREKALKILKSEVFDKDDLQ